MIYFTYCYCYYSQIRELMGYLEKRRPSYGYFPEPSKSILIVSPENKASAQNEFAGKGFTIITGHRIGDEADLNNWLSKKASNWELTVKDLASVAIPCPQTAYSGLQKSLQSEWQFVQRVKPGIAKNHFSGIEKNPLPRLPPRSFP
jgi:hypothetical protein